ncbi:MAG: LLM class flavin-dependent oxidoreductase [Defluviicoccus sp.]|nr:LLM class flavin-dependent oxidoreductase [Defluviicoccus sp.]
MSGFGVSFDGFASFADALALARRAEEAGADGLWMAEHLGYRQSLVSCTAFALRTARARVVPTAISPYLWSPVSVAMAMATIAEAAPGRVALALGSGNPMFLAEAGAKLERPLTAMREFIACLRQLWSGEPGAYRGEMFRLDGMRMAFLPPEPIPLYLAAMGPRMLRLAGALADGVVLSAGLTVDYCARSLAMVEAGAREAERDPAALRRAAYVYIAVDPDRAAAVERLRPKIAFMMRNDFVAPSVAGSGITIDRDAVKAAISRRDMGAAASLIPDEAVEAFGVCGAPGDCAARIAGYRAAGVEEIVLLIAGDAAGEAAALDLVRSLSR